MGTPGVRVVVVAALLMLVEAGVGSGLRAQDASDWLQVDAVRAVPERLEDYIELQLNEVTPALQAAGIPWRSVWRTAEFGNTYELHFVTPLGDLADYDVGGPLARVMEPDKLSAPPRPVAEVHGVARELCDPISPRSERRIRRNRKSISESGNDRPDRAGSSSRVDRVSRTEVGAVSRGESRPRCLRAGVRASTHSVADRGKPCELHRARSAQLHYQITRTFGDQAGDQAAEIAGVVVSVQRTVLRYDPELSYSSIP